MIEYLTFASGLAIGVAAGIGLEKAIAKKLETTLAERSTALRDVFGEPMCTTTLSFAEVKEWLSARQELLKDGTKAIVTKANSKNLSNLGKNINIDGVDNYLIIAVVTANNDITDSVLIKYEKLESDLEEVLAKGDGSLVVEG